MDSTYKDLRVFTLLTAHPFSSIRISCLLLSFASVVAKMDLMLLHSASTSTMRWVACGICQATIIPASMNVMVTAEMCVSNSKLSLHS